MQNSSPYRLPLLVLSVLLVTIVAGTAALLGFSSERPVPVPEWIWCSRSAEPGAECSVSLPFSVGRAVPSATLRVAASGPAKVQLDGLAVGSSGGTGEPIDIPLRDLKAGPHEIRIDASHGTGVPGICAMADLSDDGLPRIVTDASWSRAADAAGSMVTVVAPYPGGPRPSPFGAVADSVAVAKGSRFWVVLLALMGAMVVSCLAGPVLRPPGRGRRDVWVADLAILVPSILYASAACIITSVAAFEAATGVILALHAGSTAIFVLVLIAWKTGTEFISQDQVRHRGELLGYDAMCDAVESLRLDLAGAPDGLRSALQPDLQELAESVRYSSTGSSVPDVDRAILDAIESLRAAVRQGGDGEGPDHCAQRIRGVVARIREREIRLQSGRRA